MKHEHWWAGWNSEGNYNPKQTCSCGLAWENRNQKDMYIDETKEQTERRLDSIARTFQRVVPKHIDIDFFKEMCREGCDEHECERCLNGEDEH